MRKLWLGILGLAVAATTANAAVIFTMSYNDNGAGAVVANNWAVYASVDNASAGLFGFGVDLLPFTGTLLNRANGVVMSDSSTGELLNLGFTAGRTADAANGKFSGLADLGAGTAMKPVYTFGKQTDDLDNYIPPNFDSQDSTLGAGRNPYGVETYTPAGGQPKNMFLLGRGTWTGAVRPAIDTTSVDTLASVYLTNSGTANARAPLFFDSRDIPPPPPPNFVGLANTANVNTPTNVAVGGAIAVSGANNAYISEVDQLTADNVTAGNAPIQTIGDEPGAVYVMARLNGTQAAIDSFLNSVTADVGPSDSQFAALHAAYDSQFAGGSFNALFRFNNIPGAKVFSIDTTGTFGVSVDQLAAVPEPAAAMVTLCASLASLLRRRKTGRPARY